MNITSNVFPFSTKLLIVGFLLHIDFFSLVTSFPRYSLEAIPEIVTFGMRFLVGLSCGKSDFYHKSLNICSRMPCNTSIKAY